jgi:hypothetical protein
MRIIARFHPILVERQLEVDDDMTVMALRGRLEEELRLLGIAAPIRALVCGRPMYIDDRTLAECNVRDGSVVHVPLTLPSFQLSVATDWGVIVLSVAPYAALSSVKQTLADTHNIDTSGLALLCGGEPLDDSVQLRSVNVGAGSRLTLARVP